MIDRLLKLWESGQLSARALLLYMCLYRRAAAARRWEVSCSYDTLQQFLHESRETLCRSIQELEKAGFIHHRPGNNRNPGQFVLISRPVAGKKQPGASTPYPDPAAPQPVSTAPQPVSTAPQPVSTEGLPYSNSNNNIKNKNININNKNIKMKNNDRSVSAFRQDKDKFEKENLWMI